MMIVFPNRTRLLANSFALLAFVFTFALKAEEPILPPLQITPLVGPPPATSVPSRPDHGTIVTNPLQSSLYSLPSELSQEFTKRKDEGLFGQFFPDDLYLGTQKGLTHSQIRKLISEMPMVISSPTVRAIVIRTLASHILSVTRKGNDSKVQSTEENEENLLDRCIQYLAALGAWGVLDNMLAMVVDSVDRPSVKRLVNEALWMNGRKDDACAGINASLLRLGDLYWLTAKTACLVLANQKDQARLNIELLRDSGVEEPFLLVLTSKNDDNQNLILPDTLEITPLVFGFLRAARLPITHDMINNAAGRVARAVAMMPPWKHDDGNGSLPLQLIAAERAAILGAMSIDELDKFYVNFSTGGDVSTSLTYASGFMRVIAYRAVRERVLSPLRSTELAHGIIGSPNDKLYPVMAMLMKPFYVNLVPSPELIPYAPEIVRALIAVGVADSAKPWVQLLTLSANGEQQHVADELWLLQRLAASSETPIAREEIRAWFNVERAPSDDVFRQRALLGLRMLNALGNAVPEDIMESLKSDSDSIPKPKVAAIIDTLQKAVRERNLAEALLVIAKNGEIYPTLSPLLTYEIVRTLHDFGLLGEARAYAVEAALAGGL